MPMVSGGSLSSRGRRGRRGWATASACISCRNTSGARHAVAESIQKNVDVRTFGTVGRAALSAQSDLARIPEDLDAACPLHSGLLSKWLRRWACYIPRPSRSLVSWCSPFSWASCSVICCPGHHPTLQWAGICRTVEICVDNSFSSPTIVRGSG